MEDADVVKVLQHYRHDLMNHLQIVQGYLSMNKADKANEKLKAVIALYEEERKLMHLKMPAFTLWVMQMNTRFNHIKFEYRILTEKKMPSLNHAMTTKCEEIISAINKAYGIEELYEISMEIKDVESASFIEVNFLIKGEHNQEQSLGNLLEHENVQVRQTASGIVCSFQIQ